MDDDGVPNAYEHRFRVRFGECDPQGVVFNAHYLAYVDDVVDRWWEDVLGAEGAVAFECLVKRAEVEWSSPARRGDHLVLRAGVGRWGRSSFDVVVHGETVEGRPVFRSQVTYVAVVPGTATPQPVPQEIRRAFGG